jgi:hypothetical protein
MTTRRFLLSWIFSSVGMWGISYLWHGFFLNDITNLNYPKGIYLMASTIVYMVIGFLLTRIFSLQFTINIFRNFFVRGIACGAVVGVLLYMFMIVLGVSFTKNLSMANMIIDIPWQLFEQSFGGILIALTYVLIYEPLPRNRSEEIV